MKATDHTNKALIEAAFDALNRRDRDAFVGLHAEDAVLHHAGEEVRGIQALADAEFAYFDAFPDLTVSIDRAVEEGDTVAVRWTVTGTHGGSFRGIEPTGKTIEISTMGMFRIADGRVSEVWLESDRLGLLEQLGAVDPPTG